MLQDRLHEVTYTESGVQNTYQTAGQEQHVVAPVSNRKHILEIKAAVFHLFFNPTQVFPPSLPAELVASQPLVSYTPRYRVASPGSSHNSKTTFHFGTRVSCALCLPCQLVPSHSLGSTYQRDCTLRFVVVSLQQQRKSAKTLMWISNANCCRCDGEIASHRECGGALKHRMVYRGQVEWCGGRSLPTQEA